VYGFVFCISCMFFFLFFFWGGGGGGAFICYRVQAEILISKLIAKCVLLDIMHGLYQGVFYVQNVTSFHGTAVGSKFFPIFFSW